mmetsp:Transcript_5177/g.16600  ORF Transcript_5177/g.16600 Transcript_5177/m.16600 type:complete len:408 (-) Transcript_5177:122-1345(-)
MTRSRTRAATVPKSPPPRSAGSSSRPAKAARSDPDDSLEGALDFDALSPDLAPAKKASKSRPRKRPAPAAPVPIDPRRTPSLELDDDSIKEDCDDNEQDGLIVKGPWSEPEDAMLRSLVAEQGAKRWSAIAAKLPGRIGKQCRERWHNHLTPDVKKEKFTAEEDKAIVAAVARHGTRWCQIVKEMPGRSDNAIKNRWNALTRKLQRMRRRESQRESERERAAATVRSGELVLRRPAPRLQGGQELGGQPGGQPAAQQMLASPTQAAELARQLLASGLDLGLLARTLEGREPDPASAHATDQRRQADAALLVHATLTHEPLAPLAVHAPYAAEEASGGAPAGAESPSVGLGLLLAAGEDGDGEGPAVAPHPSPRAVAVVRCLGALSGGAPPSFLFEMPPSPATFSTSS